VAGDLGSIHSEYKTTSGKVVQLGIFSDKENVGELFVLESICSLPQFTFPFLYCCIAVLISYGLKMDLNLVDCLPSSFFSPSPFDLFSFYSTSYTLHSPLPFLLCLVHHPGKLEHAMYSIKRSMQWDEDVFGLECDLDLYNIVATNDFNMGAM
jgi:hypothetical protein